MYVCMYVCVCTCMYVYVCVCMCMYVYVYVCVRMYMYMYMCIMYVCMYACMYVCVYVCVLCVLCVLCVNQPSLFITTFFGHIISTTRRTSYLSWIKQGFFWMIWWFFAVYVCRKNEKDIYIHIEDDGVNTSKYGIILDHMSFSITNNSRQSYGVKQPRWRLKSRHCWMKYSPISTVIYWSLGSLWETPWFELRINNMSGCMMLPIFCNDATNLSEGYNPSRSTTLDTGNIHMVEV